MGWAGGDPTKGFGFITPKHYVVARHYGGAPTITLLSASGQLVIRRRPASDASRSQNHGRRETDGSTRPSSASASSNEVVLLENPR